MQKSSSTSPSALIHAVARTIDLMEAASNHHVPQDQDKLSLLAKLINETKERLMALIRLAGDKTKEIFNQAMKLLGEWKAERRAIWQAAREKRERHRMEREAILATNAL